MDVKNIYKFPIIQRDFSKIYTGAICEKHKILQNIGGYFKKLWRPHVKKKITKFVKLERFTKIYVKRNVGDGHRHLAFTHTDTPLLRKFCKQNYLLSFNKTK